MKPHLYSFPTMYNTWGLRIQESTEKNGRTRKSASFSSNFLAVFLDHLSSRDSSYLFCSSKKAYFGSHIITLAETLSYIHSNIFFHLICMSSIVVCWPVLLYCPLFTTVNPKARGWWIFVSCFG